MNKLQEQFIKGLERLKAPQNTAEAEWWFNQEKHIFFDLQSEIPKAVSLHNNAIDEAIELFKKLVN